MNRRRYVDSKCYVAEAHGVQQVHRGGTGLSWEVREGFLEEEWQSKDGNMETRGREEEHPGSRAAWAEAPQHLGCWMARVLGAQRGQAPSRLCGAPWVGQGSVVLICVGF